MQKDISMICSRSEIVLCDLHSANV